MARTNTSESSSLLGGLIDMPQQHVMRIVLLGVGVGIVGWLLSLVIYHVILTPLFCGDVSSSQCAGATGSAANIASIVMAVVGLLGLVRLSVYRPLLIVVAVVVSLWGLGGWTTGLPWYETLSWWAVLYALCYITFSWLVRPRAFAPAVVLIVVAVVLIRLLPML